MEPIQDDIETVREGIVHEVSGDPGIEWCFSCHASLAECSGPAALAALDRLVARLATAESERDELRGHGVSGQLQRAEQATSEARTAENRAIAQRDYERTNRLILLENHNRLVAERDRLIQENEAMSDVVASAKKLRATMPYSAGGVGMLEALRRLEALTKRDL